MQRENLRVRRGGAPIFVSNFIRRRYCATPPSPSPFGVPFANLEAHMIHISKSKSKLLNNNIKLKAESSTYLTKIKASF